MSAVAELRAEVLKLRGEGLSFSKVAEKLGISKAYSVKLAKSDRTPETDTGHRNGHQRSLNVRQRRFVAGLAEGQSQREAAVNAGVPPKGADTWAWRTLKDEKVQESFSQLLDRKGLGEERLAEIHAENLQAMKTVKVTSNIQGEIVSVLERPDFATRQRALRDAWMLRGRIGSNDSEGGGTQINIGLFYETAKKIENLTGRRVLPADFQPIEDGPENDSLPEASAGDSARPSDPNSAQADDAVWGDW